MPQIVVSPRWLPLTLKVEFSRSMVAILEMPQYVAYPKNLAYAVIKLSAKSHNFHILYTMNVLSCPTNCCEESLDHGSLNRTIQFQC